MKWPRAGGPAPANGVARSRPEDFFVDERLGFEATGQGEHVLVHVRKTGANTAWVASCLARAAGVRPRDVSYAGRKDRHAVTQQWFSVWLPGRQAPEWDALDIEGVTILNATRHSRKLRRGSLQANRFTIRIRQLSGDLPALETRLAGIAVAGVPNYFGAQRFGTDGNNVQLAQDLFAGRIRLRRERRSMALSAARSLIFNAVLAARIEAGSWLTALPGDALNLDGGRSFFVCAEPDADIAARVAAGDLHVTGPLWGRGDNPVGGQIAELEQQIAKDHETLAAGLVANRLEHERRPLRVRPRDLKWEIDGDVLTLSFELPRGAFATAVLDEVLEYKTLPPPGR